MQEISPESSSLAERTAVLLATFAALALLGLVLAYWTWIWIAPRAESPAQVAGESAPRLESAYALFGSARRDTAAATGLALRLLGVVAASRGRHGQAIMQLDSKQTVVIREQAEVSPGVRLAEVHADHVIIERGGIRQRLAWPEKSASKESSPLAPGVSGR